MSQEEKEFLNLAGEFHVAGELARNRIRASITYGNSKSADIFAYSELKNRFAKIEVKATEKNKVIVGDRALGKNARQKNEFWVLVAMGSGIPEYYVLSSREIFLETKTEFDVYNSRYKERHGKNYTKQGVNKVAFEKLGKYKNEWGKIKNFLDA